MALFPGEEIVEFQTPDGRTHKLPRSIVPASLMPQQVAQTPPGFADETVLNVAPPDPTSVTGGALPPAEPQQPAFPIGTPPVQNSPDFPIGKVDNTDAAVAKSNKAFDKQERAQAAAAASPQGQMAGVEQQTQTAIGDEKAAVIDAANVDAAAQDMLAQAAEQHNQRIDGYINDKARIAQERFEAEEAKANEIGALRKKIAGTKIDRKADHPILAAISIALAGLGSAMKGESTNPGLEMFWRALDRKVAGQMADLDLMEKTYGMQKDELASFKDMTGRKLEVYNGMIAGEADKAKRHLEEIIAKSASEKTKANAKIMMAQIDQRAAAAHQGAVRWGLDYDQKERAEKNQNHRFYTQLSQQERHHRDDVQLKREDMYLDWQKHLGDIKAKGDEASYKAQLEMVKDNQETGIRGVDGEFLLTKAGRAKMDQAAQLEAEAAKLEETGKADPMSFSVKGGKDKVAEMREQAARLRGSARTVDVVKHRDKTQAGKFSDAFAAAQTVITQIDNIKALSQRGRDFFYTDAGRAELQAAFNALAPTLKEAWQLGAWDKGSAGLVEKIIGGDPSAWMSVIQKLEAPDAFLGRLETVARNLETGVKNQLSRQTGWTGDTADIFGRKTLPDQNTPTGKAFAKMSQDKTPSERSTAAAKSGESTVANISRAIGYPFSPSYKEEAAQLAESGSVKHLGLLSKEQGASFDALLKDYQGGNARVGDMLVAQVVNNADSRPDFAIATLKNLREHAPDLYVKARGLVKTGPVAEQMDYEESNRIGAAQMPTSTLTRQARIGDEESKRELARRATSGDKEAVRAVRELVMTKKREDLPKGSVFREGR